MRSLAWIVAVLVLGTLAAEGAWGEVTDENRLRAGTDSDPVLAAEWDQNTECVVISYEPPLEGTVVRGWSAEQAFVASARLYDFVEEGDEDSSESTKLNTYSFSYTPSMLRTWGNAAPRGLSTFWREPMEMVREASFVSEPRTTGQVTLTTPFGLEFDQRLDRVKVSASAALTAYSGAIALGGSPVVLDLEAGISHVRNPLEDDDGNALETDGWNGDFGAKLTWYYRGTAGAFKGWTANFAANAGRGFLGSASQWKRGVDMRVAWSINGDEDTGVVLRYRRGDQIDSTYFADDEFSLGLLLGGHQLGFRR